MSVELPEARLEVRTDLLWDDTVEVNESGCHPRGNWSAS